MNEEYLIGIFRKALIEAKAAVMTQLGYGVLEGDPEIVGQIVQLVERYETLLRDEKALRKTAKAVLELKP